ncbi:MAG: selenium-dependent molybdenum cofactor biosynthesis protein YqeB [Collinsella sp.]
MLVYVRGAGDIATGVALAWCAPACRSLWPISRFPRASAAQSVLRGHSPGRGRGRGIRARLAQTPAEALAITEAGDVAVVVDPQAKMLDELKPAAVVDAILAKRNLGTTRDMAPAVIAVGPGFTAPVDCDAVVETMRGHFLGRVITQGSPQPNTGVPGVIAGYGKERVIHSPAAGVFRSDRAIGDIVSAGDVIGYAGDTPMVTQIDGCLRGLLADGVQVTEGFKCADVDPRGDASYINYISDKATSVGGGVLEALAMLTSVFQG